MMMKHWSGMLLLFGQPLLAESSAEEHLFLRTASSLVACYEKVGLLQGTYDEEGLCNESSGLSAWSMQAEGPVDVELQKFEALGWTPVGTYEGRVIFRNPKDALCFFKLNFVYSGEDISVEVSKFACLGS